MRRRSIPAKVVEASSWVRNSGSVPEGAVVAGKDADDCRIYVGRAPHDGDVLPSMVKNRLIHMPFAGQVFAKDNFEWLINGKMVWTPSDSGRVPVDAVRGGITEFGEILYIGRAEYRGTVVVGKIHPSHKVLYVPFDSREVKISNYDVLVERL